MLCHGGEDVAHHKCPTAGERRRAPRCHLFGGLGDSRGRDTSMAGGLWQRLRAGRAGGSPRSWLVPGLALRVLEERLFMASATATTIFKAEVGSKG